MATTLQVLCPNGRRQNVKVTPNTKLLQVLEEVCTKQGCQPFDSYVLNHGRKTLDLTLAFRFSNLPNNAKLELLKSAEPRSQVQSDVTIALQLENGERLQHTFQPSTTLWQILEHWESQDGDHKRKLTYVDQSQSPPAHPVCIYMREEVIGECALQDMTLKKLALTSGKAILRLVHRPIDDGTLSVIMGKLEQEKLNQAKLAQKALEAELSDSTSASSLPSEHNTPVDLPGTASTSAPQKQENSSHEKMDIGEVTNEEDRSEVSDESVDLCARSESTSVKDEGASAANQHGSNVDNPPSAVHAVDTSAIEQLRRMNIPGVEIFTPGNFDDLPPEEQQQTHSLVMSVMSGLFGIQPQGAKKARASPPQRPFAEFKFPEETKGKDLYHNELSEVKIEEYKPCDREVVVYDSNEENVSKAVADDPPEDFFEVTDSDVRSLYKDLQKQVSEERPLTTEAMRQAELEERYQQYHHVVIRIQFPDGLVLQGCFRPRETVFALHKFVKEHLEDKELKFYLYRTPPKQILSDMTKTLVEAYLAPATLVYFGSEKTEGHCLAGSSMMEIVPKRRAEELSVKKLARKQMEGLAAASTQVEISSPCSSGSSVGGQRAVSASGSHSDSRPAQRSGAGASGEQKVPKWLRMGK